jgi:hypothetical protein
MLLLMILYLVAKLVAYTAWCRVALRAIYEPSGDAPSAWTYGAARVTIGLAFAYVLTSLLHWVAPAPNQLGISIPVLLPALVLVRVFEWLAIGGMMLARATGPRPDRLRQVAWTAGGVGLSFAVDVAVVAVISLVMGLGVALRVVTGTLC